MRLLLLLALAMASVTLTQCRLIGDRLTGVDASLYKRKNTCKETCQDEFAVRNQAENALHAENIAACGGDATCLANEEVRHLAAEEASKTQRDACINACHQQGGGTIGP
jgi:hypothetical protein